MFSRPAPEDPVGVERLALVPAAVDPDEVARARIHGKARLSGEIPVVRRDEVVDLGEVPLACNARPVGRIGLAPRGVQLSFMLVEQHLDGAQPAHPHERPAEGAHGRLGVGPEVAQPLTQRLSLDRALGEVRLEHAPLLAVA